MIGVVDYGLGNVSAFENIFKNLGLAVCRARTSSDVEQCTRLILPGVGAFDWAMERIEQSGIKSCLDYKVKHENIPVLGVCVGMQIMAASSAEGNAKGLGWIPGCVRHMNEKEKSIQLPHMGWNNIHIAQENALFRGIEDPQYYFLHSYYFEANCDSDVLATADYGISFTAAVRRDNVWATQFHPEKSHHWGQALLKNFAGLN